jgi:hypothetical protein
MEKVFEINSSCCGDYCYLEFSEEEIFVRVKDGFNYATYTIELSDLDLETLKAFIAYIENEKGGNCETP